MTSRSQDRQDQAALEASLTLTHTEKLALTLDWLHRELLGARNRYSSALVDAQVDAQLSDMTFDLRDLAYRLAPDVVEPGTGAQEEGAYVL